MPDADEAKPAPEGGGERQPAHETADSARGGAEGTLPSHVSPSGKAWEAGIAGELRLNPVERANPAFGGMPAFGDAPAGAFGGRGPRVDDALAGAQRTTTAKAGATGRWVRTGGCSIRWYVDGSEEERPDDERYWRWVATTLEQAGEHGEEESPTPVSCGAFSYLENGDGTVTLVGYEGAEVEVEVPDTADGMPVSVLGPSLFSGHAEIERVSLPATITAIDDHAFDGCTALRRIDLPEGIERIGMLAFAKTGLSSVRIPATVHAIGEKAFFHCKRLSTVDLPDGLKVIGEMAFAYAGIERVHVPASVVQLGFNSFDLTPAQKHVARGTIEIDPANRFYSFDGTGLYREDALVELIGYVSEYSVRAGTHRIEAGAFKRHPTIANLHLPEGLVEIGEDAFRSNRCLVRVDLPESLVRIGAHAFVDTSVVSLRISRNVREIGEGALLVQGESQMKYHSGLKRIDLDARNPVFYLENGLFCERGSSPGGGDTCLLYVGPDSVVRIPEQVTTIATMAFGGSDGVDELFVHDHVHSFCHGWLSTARTVERLHVDFASAIDGYTHGDFVLPSLSSRFRYPTSLFGSSKGKTVFDFDYYDSWVTCATNVDELASAAYGRMLHPMGMSAHSRKLYEGIFQRKGLRICRYFAERGMIEAIEMLVDRGYLDRHAIDAELEHAMREGSPQATACLLEIRHRMDADGPAGIDFSL